MKAVTILLFLSAPSGPTVAEICRVECPNGNGIKSIGHGVLVGIDAEGFATILTAKHVIRGSIDKPTVIFRGSGAAEGGTAVVLKITEWAESASYDLAGLRVKLTPYQAAALKPTPIAQSRPAPNSIIGSVRTRGPVRYGPLNEQGHPLLEYGGHSVQGDSGGPIRDALGRLVSIVCTTDGHNTHGPPPEIIARFLRQFSPS